MKQSEPDIEILGPDEFDDDFAGTEKKRQRIAKRFWPTVRKALGAIPFMDEVVAAYYAMLDPQTPRAARLTLIGALAYFVMPLDMIPDFIFSIGFIDDASVLTAALAAVSAAIKPEHREAARKALADENDGAKS